MLGTDLAGLDALALKATPGSAGLVLIPYLDGERTPSLPEATGTLGGLTRGNMSPENVARALVEGMLCGLADGLDALTAQGIRPQRVLLIGGAAQSRAVRAIAPEIFGLPVNLPDPAENVALGAAKQAAWSLAAQTDAKSNPRWERPEPLLVNPPNRPAHDGVRAAYRALLDTVHG